MTKIWDHEGINMMTITSIFLLPVVQGGDYCWFLHEDYYIVKQKFCENGCCSDYGDDEDICCFSWTIGIILGVIFAVIALISGVVVLVICCVMAKKKRGPGPAVHPAVAHQYSNTIVCTSGSAFAYPHPPSAFYPMSQYPHSPNSNPHDHYGNSASGQPPPQFPPPPPYSAVSGQSASGPHDDGNAHDQYGGYGKGMN